MPKDKRKWIDISVTLKSGMVHWPGDPPVIVKRMKDIKKGSNANVSFVSMGTHTGTHMDAPLHFLESGRGIDKAPLGAVIGQARVISIKDKVSIKPEELRKYRIRKGERLIFKTLNSQRCWKADKFIKDFVYISNEAAKYLAGICVRTVGVDYLSVGGYKKDGANVHKLLLAKGVWIMEGLNLSNVKQGYYDLVCLPLKILDSDGSPARAVIRRQ